MPLSRIHLIAAARPNFMKVAPLYHALKAQPWCDVGIVHTGQHYDANMSDAFFRDLRLPEPRHHLEVGSGSHAEQTGGVMIAYEKVCLAERPDWIVVVGDVNSTAACAMVGAKLWIPVVHLEAGLRSRDRSMPEEINRLVTDAISDVLWTPSVDGDENLIQEGVDPARIDRVGNIMIDSYEMMRPQIEQDETPRRMGLERGKYIVVTLHRPSNVDRRETLATVGRAAGRGCGTLAGRVRSPSAHAQEARGIRPAGAAARERARFTSPSRSATCSSWRSSSGAAAAVTDSGGVQEETTYLGIPCLTLRENTERPITVTQGSNRLVQPLALLENVERVLAGKWPAGSRPEGWDGHAAQRCVAALLKRERSRRARAVP